MPRPSLRRTVELERIEALPRRVLTLADAQAWADVLTPVLRLPESRAQLRPPQGALLAELAESQFGAFGGLTVGTGKTLVLYLAPLLCKSLRPLAIMPANLEAKTWSDFAEYECDWQPHRVPLKIVSREAMARAEYARLLDEYRPDLIMNDEGDELSRHERGAPARITRHLKARRAAGDVVRMLSMTGSPTRLSIFDYWHILQWCLGSENAPLPQTKAEAQLWASVLDEKTRAVRRPNPGPLGANREQALRWYRDRLLQTPGVVVFDGDSCDAPLTIRTRLALEDPVLDKHYRDFLLKFQNPGGITISDPLSRWQMDGLMGCGLYRYWDPPPPEAWVLARRAKDRFVRQRIAYSAHTSHPLDTEMQVIKRYQGHPIVAEWLRVRDSFAGETCCAWLTRSTIDSAIAWLRESPDAGIIWCGSVDYAQALARAARLPYYGRRGECEDGTGLHEARPGQSFVASWNANKKGWNLQAWHRALIVLPPQSAKWIEQIIGREHRSGQRDPVTVDFLMTSGGTIDAFEAALREAQFAAKSVALTQKILRATIIRARPRITPSNRYRWASRTDKEAQQNGKSR